MSATATTTCEPIWLQHPKTGYVVLVTHEDTRARCLSEGWTIARDPSAPAPAPVSEPIPVPVPVPVAPVAIVSEPVNPDAAPAAAPADVTTQLAQPSVAGHSFDDLTAVGDSPEELAQALEAATIVETRARNTAARTAFGIETPTPPVQSVKPAKAGQTQQRGGRYAG